MSRVQTMVLGLAALAGVGWASGCSDGSTEPPPPDPPRPTVVTVTPAAAELTALGETVRLRAEVRDQNGQAMTGTTVNWASSSASVATVSAAGLVTAAANGAATITATAGGASGTATVTVEQTVSAVAVAPAADTLVAGDTLRLAAEAADANGHAVTGAEFDWASGDTAIALVDAMGLVTGAGAGEVEITATSAGVTGRAALVVAAPAPTTVAVTPDALVFTALGDTLRLKAEVRDQLGRPVEDEPVVWTSGASLVATVDSAGLVTAAANGAATIAATAGEASGTAVVTVTQSVASVAVSPSADTVALGDTLRLAAEAADANGHAVTGAEFAWSSSDTTLATVESSGLVTGVAEGMATITATVGSAQGTAQITVENPDRAALVALFEATDGPNWSKSDNWLTDAPLHDWYGVRTNAYDRVTYLSLTHNGLEGPIPPELGALSGITELYLWENALTGPIPLELTSLTKLIGLSLLDNKLTGRVPPELGNLTRLRHLNLYGNEFTGVLPSSLLRIEDLSYFEYGVNKDLCAPGTSAFVTWLQEIDSHPDSHYGPWPLCNESVLPVLASLYEAMGGPGWTNSDGWLGNGAVEDWHGVASDSLGFVTELDLSYNGLSGTVPVVLSELISLTVLRVAGNEDLSGRLPLALTALSLRDFHYADTALCTPANRSFREWLEGIASHEGTGEECGLAFLGLEIADTDPLTSAGATVELSVTGIADDGNQPVDNALVEWQSSDTAVATVSEGVVTAARGGYTTITASYEEHTAETAVGVWISTMRERSVRVLYVVPADKEFRADYSRAISKTVVDVQAWYRRQLDGATYDLYRAVPEFCHLPRNEEYYAGTDVWSRILRDVQRCAPVSDRGRTPYSWALYVDVHEKCDGFQELGRGGDRLTMLAGYDLALMAAGGGRWTFCDVGNIYRSYGSVLGGFAHELAHTFLIPHPPECDPVVTQACDPKLLMAFGWDIYPDTYFSEREKAMLLRSRFIKR